MASRYYGDSASSSPNLIELSDSDEIYSVSEEEVTQREMTDRQLGQAINYMHDDGGPDTLATFMNRVARIDEALLQQLPQHGGDFDPKLYRRLRAMVLEAQRDFEEAAAENPSPIETDDEDLPEYYTPSAAEEALYKEPDVAESPRARPSGPCLEPRSSAPKDYVSRTREFKYGGPKNEVEVWQRDFPAILPFPETLQMEHWESLKIDYDLTVSNKLGLKALENSIPFNHPALNRYKDLHHYDSGSRFKLPVPRFSDERRINELGTEQRLKKIVDAFNRGDRDQEVTKDYVPRVFLESFAVGRQASPTAIRRAVNVTPTKSRGTSNANTTSPPSHSRRKESEPTEAESPKQPVKPPVKWDHMPDSQIRSSAPHSSSSAAFRRISNTRKEALRENPRRGSNPSTNMHTEATRETPRREAHSSTSKRGSMPPTTSKQPSGKVLADRVEIPVKRGRGRPPKVPKRPAPTPAPVIVDNTPPSKKTSIGKRKRSIGSTEYTPDGKRKKSLGSEDFTPSSLKKATRSAKKTVDFSDPLIVSSDEEEDISVSPVLVPIPRVRKENRVSKAMLAGRAAAAEKRVIRVSEETVTEVEYQPSRTPSSRKGVASGSVAKKGAVRSGTRSK